MSVWEHRTFRDGGVVVDRVFDDGLRPGAIIYLRPGESIEWMVAPHRTCEYCGRHGAVDAYQCDGCGAPVRTNRATLRTGNAGAGLAKQIG